MITKLSILFYLMYNKQQKRDVQRDNKIVNGSGKFKRSWTAKKKRLLTHCSIYKHCNYNFNVQLNLYGIKIEMT